MVGLIGIVTGYFLLSTDPGSEWLRPVQLDAADQEPVALLPGKRFSVPVSGIPKKKKRKFKLSYYFMSAPLFINEVLRDLALRDLSYLPRS